MSGKRPVGASVAFLSAQKQSSATAALAACNADPACTMFTTDGWIMGTQVYVTKNGNIPSVSAVLDPESGLRDEYVEINWEGPYCGECNDAPGCCGSSKQGPPCCGTYVAAASAATGQLEVQAGKSGGAPAIFNTGDCSAGGCLPRWTVVAVDAPCTGQALTSNVTVDSCNPVFGSCTLPRCSVPVLGAALDDTGQRAYKASEMQAVRVDQRCSLTLEQVQHAGYPRCCKRCWSACCKAMNQHNSRFANYTIKPLATQGQEVNRSLDFPANGRCSATDVAVAGSCCQQLQYLKAYMPLEDPVEGGIPCTLECALNCGFVHVQTASRRRADLWCVATQIMYSGAGLYPLWVTRQYLVKRSASVAGPSNATVASKHACSLC